MRFARSLIGWLLGSSFLLAIAPCHGQEPPDPLRLIPIQADFVAKIERPAKLVEKFYSLPILKDLQKIDAVREALDSTNARRADQLIGYFEKKLGMDRYALLDKLACGGIAVGIKIAKEPAPAVAVIQGRDEETTRQFVATALEILQSELTRQESKERIERSKYHDIEVVRIGNDLRMAVAGSAIIFASRDEAMKAALDLHLGRSKSTSVLKSQSVANTRAMLPENPVAWACFDLKIVQNSDEGAKFFKDVVEQQPFFNITIFGSVLNLARRAPFVCAGFYDRENGYTTKVLFPSGLKEMDDKTATFFPTQQGSTLPLLEPEGVLSSTSYYLDIAKIWDSRDKLLSSAQAKQLETFEKNSGRFLGGTKVGDLVHWLGPHQRIVVCQQVETVYKEKKPNVPIPAFALVQETRDPAFGKAMDRILGTVALLGAAGFNVKMVEEKVGDVTIVSYRFPEDRDFPGDNDNLRYNFSPSYAYVNNQFIASSTLPLARQLVKLVQSESQQSIPVAMRMRAYSSGGALALQSVEDQVITQFMLGQALSPEEARRQADTLIDLVSRLGWLQIETIYRADASEITATLEFNR